MQSWSHDQYIDIKTINTSSYQYPCSWVVGIVLSGLLDKYIQTSRTGTSSYELVPHLFVASYNWSTRWVYSKKLYSFQINNFICCSQSNSCLTDYGRSWHWLGRTLDQHNNQSVHPHQSYILRLTDWPALLFVFSALSAPMQLQRNWQSQAPVDRDISINLQNLVINNYRPIIFKNNAEIKNNKQSKFQKKKV